MIQFPRVATLVVGLAVVFLGTLSSAQQAKVVTQPGYHWPANYLMLPGYYQLAREQVQKDIELVPEQLEKLKALSKKYQEQLNAERQQWKDWGKMTREERTAKYKEWSEKRKKQAEEVSKEVEKILLPHQIEALQDMNFRARASSMLYQPQIVEKLGITADQKAKIQQVRQEMTDKYQQIQKETLEKILRVLTPEQKEKLKQQVKTRGY